MGTWSLEAENRRKEYEELMARRRDRTPVNSFYQKPSVYRAYNVERCAYTRSENASCSKSN